jgi:hypothetical protein
LLLYIQPVLKDGEGAVIYKLMPHGEVIRNFHLNMDGLAILEGAPDSGFPPTHPNILTLYMDDDEVCRRKHEWGENTSRSSTRRLQNVLAKQASDRRKE